MSALLTNPLLYFLGLLFLIALSLLLKRWRLQAIAVLVPLTAISYFVLTPLGANYLANRIAAQPGESECTAVLAVINGTGLDRAPRNPRDFAAMSNVTFDKVVTAVDWLNENADRQLVITGKYETRDARIPTDAAIAYRYVAETGIARERIVYNPHPSRSVFENTQSVYDLIDEREVTLISSTLSGRREQATFEKHGFKACNLPVGDPKVEAWSILAYVPSGESISLAHEALYEIAATLWYRWTDKI